MAAPQSTPLPPAPSRAEGEAVFVPKANAFLGALEPLRVDIQAQADFVNDAVVSVNSDMLAAQSSAQVAQDSANFVGKWSELTGSYSVGISVAHNDLFWRLLSDVADIAQEEPSVSAVWQSTSVLPSGVQKFTIIDGCLAVVME